jgi:hypothetical protein
MTYRWFEKKPPSGSKKAYWNLQHLKSHLPQFSAWESTPYRVEWMPVNQVFRVGRRDSRVNGRNKVYVNWVRIEDFHTLEEAQQFAAATHLLGESQ